MWPASATLTAGMLCSFWPWANPCCHSTHQASLLSTSWLWAPAPTLPHLSPSSCCRLEEEAALPWLWPAFATLSAGIALLMLAVGLPVLPWHRYGSEKLRSGSSMRSGGLTAERVHCSCHAGCGASGAFLAPLWQSAAKACSQVGSHLRPLESPPPCFPDSTAALKVTGV